MGPPIPTRHYPSFIMLQSQGFLLTDASSMPSCAALAGDDITRRIDCLEERYSSRLHCLRLPCAEQGNTDEPPKSKEPTGCLQWITLRLRQSSTARHWLAGCLRHEQGRSRTKDFLIILCHAHLPSCLTKRVKVLALQCISSKK
jgi:hypothetical protein